MIFLGEVAADRGGPATIFFHGDTAFDEFEVDHCLLINGGVMHADADGNVRWHPGQQIRMVIWGNR